MAQSKNRLLSRLVLIGVASVGVMTHQQAAARIAGEMPGVNVPEADTQTQIMSIVAFLRSHPDSPMAAKIAAQLVALLHTLSPAARAQVVEAIAKSGGLPEQVALLVGLPGLATAALPPVKTASIY